MNVKRTIIKAAIVLLLIAALIVLAISLKNALNEISRLKSNYEAAISEDNAVQQELTKKELKKYFAEELAKLKEYGIKAKNVENIINVEYRIVDSTRYRDTLVWVYDTLGYERISPFYIDGDCYTMEGIIFGDTLEILCHQSNDEILVSVYREKRKCLFGKQKVRAIAISQCTGDTVSVTRNIKVKRKGR